jgi:hypothetical protein
MREHIPPVFANPSLISSPDISVFILILAENKWPIKIEYMEEGIIVKDVDR